MCHAAATKIGGINSVNVFIGANGWHGNQCNWLDYI